MPRTRADRANVTPDEVRTRAALVQLSAVAGFVIPFAAFLAPYAAWRVYRGDGAFVDRHGRAAVDVNLAFVSVEAVVFAAAGAAVLLEGPPGLVVALMLSALAVGLAHVGAILYGAVRAVGGAEMDLAFRVPWLTR